MINPTKISHNIKFMLNTFLEFQQNSSTATMMLANKPQRSTTNTPPMFFTLSGFAFESLLLSCSMKNGNLLFVFSNNIVQIWKVRELANPQIFIYLSLVQFSYLLHFYPRILKTKIMILDWV